MVSTGIERGFGAELRLWLGRTLARPGGRARLYAFLAALAVTAVLQSSTATGLMAASFTASGAIGLDPALAVMLGANIGTTLITQILAFNIAEVAPILVLIGVVIFRSSNDRRGRNLGRVGIGLGLMLPRARDTGAYLGTGGKRCCTLLHYAPRWDRSGASRYWRHCSPRH
jgi:phosphate:Na+ symporter